MPEITNTTPEVVDRFQVDPIGEGFAVVDRRWFASEDEAMAYARTMVSPSLPQVTITDHRPGDGLSFAVRHLTWRAAAPTVDNGWKRFA